MGDARFEQRKADHIRIALGAKAQAVGLSGLEQIRLRHEALPELDFDQIDTQVLLFSRTTTSPLFVSSMTAGHSGSVSLNLVMAKVCEKRNWVMGVGSQRRQLFDASAASEWKEIRKQCRRVRLFGNIGLSQVIRVGTDVVRALVDSLEGEAMIVHLNALQECLQPEGTPMFAGGLKAIEKLCREIGVPVVIKETGCGMSGETLLRLKNLGIAAVDVGGLGGTHWGRVEGERSDEGSLLRNAADTFADWGVSTVDSLLHAKSVQPDYAVWASGGVRSGLDAAKLIAMGAQMVGLAQPIIAAALKGEESLDQRMAQIEFELKTSMFCTGSKTIGELQEKDLWHRQT